MMQHVTALQRFPYVVELVVPSWKVQKIHIAWCKEHLSCDTTATWTYFNSTITHNDGWNHITSYLFEDPVIASHFKMVFG